jgi:hypothetical protein
MPVSADPSRQQPGNADTTARKVIQSEIFRFKSFD